MTEFLVKKEILDINNENFFFLSIFEKKTKNLIDFKIANSKKDLASSETERLMAKILKSSMGTDSTFSFFLEKDELNRFFKSEMATRLQEKFQNFQISFFEIEDNFISSFSFLNVIPKEILEKIWHKNEDVKKNKLLLL